MYEPDAAIPWKILGDYGWGLVGRHVVAILAIIVAAAPVYTAAWAAFSWALQRRDDRKNKEFETYHRLIKELGEPESGAKCMYLDRQIAIIFELRRFEFYRPVTGRILTGIKSELINGVLRLHQEIDIAIKAIGETED